MAFSNKLLEECLIYFKMCGDGKKYVYIVRYGVYRYMRSMYGYFVRNMFCKINGSMRWINEG